MSGSENQSRLKTWLLDKKQKYLSGWDREPTVVLLGSAILLTLYRFYSSRAFFRKHLAKYAARLPFAGLHLHYYWFLSSLITLMLLPMLVVKFGVKGPSPRLRLPAEQRQTGLGIRARRMADHDPRSAPRRAPVPGIPNEIPSQQTRRRQLENPPPLRTCLRRLPVRVGVFLPRIHAIRAEKRFGNYSILIRPSPSP